MTRVSLDDPKYYFNRHTSWLAFNRRVLEEALDERNPLLERVKFLAITASNLDEFVEIRLAGLLQETEQGSREAGPDGLIPEAQLERLAQDLHAFVEDLIIQGACALLPIGRASLRYRFAPFPN
jgi:polyphosphate kinase